MDDASESEKPAAKAVWSVTLSGRVPLSESDLENATPEELREFIAGRSRQEVEEEARWANVARSPDRLPFPVQARVGRTRDGRLVCTGLRLGSDRLARTGDEAETEITQRALRNVNLRGILTAMRSIQLSPEQAKVIDAVTALVDFAASRGTADAIAATENALQKARDTPEGVAGLIEAAAERSSLHLATFFPHLDPVAPLPRIRPGRHGYDRAFFEQLEPALADVYARAVRMNPRRPARQVAVAYYISEPTARRWIKKAQAFGLLQDTPA